ncbi:hypothetical protein JSY14_03110 [Brachybacterium sp. EF45031]|uniref:adenylate/guanylate cyclase domain-containing protein n=1 Tax=Brachybacterium sillae TaxID=2810536 RepID=UPI00217CE938|nr:adenylate/guanylate cyclase domain-containing protein [Brachybacterium sillae]MCS6711053.1 hypothetical protein [Brachybacterium sillae]
MVEQSEESSDPAVPLQWVRSTGSTQDEARAALAAGSEAPFAVATDDQRQGRGRLDRSWVTPAGSGLALTLAHRSTLPPPRRGWYPHAVGVAALEVLHRLGAPLVAGAAPGSTSPAGHPGGDRLGLKWPNDLHTADGRKLGGILLEGHGTDHVLVGLGLNLRGPVREATGAPVPGAAWLNGPGGLVVGTDDHRTEPPVWPWDAQALAAALARRVAARLAGLDRTGGDAEAIDLAITYRESCITLGRGVRVSALGGSSAGMPDPSVDVRGPVHGSALEGIALGWTPRADCCCSLPRVMSERWTSGTWSTCETPLTAPPSVRPPRPFRPHPRILEPPRRTTVSTETEPPQQPSTIPPSRPEDAPQPPPDDELDAALSQLLGRDPGAGGDAETHLRAVHQRFADVRRSVAALEDLLLQGPRTYTRRDLARLEGVDERLTAMYWRSLGFSTVDGDTAVFTEEDAYAIGDLAALVEEGVISEQTFANISRGMGFHMGRLAMWLTEALVEEAKTGRGLSDPEARMWMLEEMPELVETLETQVMYAFRRQLAAYSARAGSEVLHAAEDDHPDELFPLHRAVGFADLVQFTRLALQLSGSELADVISTFEIICRDTVSEGGGRVVKTVGDEVMFLADTPEAGAQIAVSISEAIAQEAGLPAVRVGMAWGSMFSRYGDVFGPTVNLAARLEGMAEPGTVLVDDATAEAVERAAPGAFRIEDRRTVDLHGIGPSPVVHLGRGDSAPLSLRL